MLDVLKSPRVNVTCSTAIIVSGVLRQLLPQRNEIESLVGRGPLLVQIGFRNTRRALHAPGALLSGHSVPCRTSRDRTDLCEGTWRELVTGQDIWPNCRRKLGVRPSRPFSSLIKSVGLEVWFVTGAFYPCSRYNLYRVRGGIFSNYVFIQQIFPF